MIQLVIGTIAVLFLASVFAFGVLTLNTWVNTPSVEITEAYRLTNECVGHPKHRRDLKWTVNKIGGGKVYFENGTSLH